MKYIVIIIVLSVSLYEVDNLLCQSFNKKTKLFEQYCENIRGITPNNCTKLTIVEPCKVLHMKIVGCDGDIVWNVVGRYHQIITLDLSHSAYKSLNWLDGSNFNLKQLRKLNASHNDVENVWKLLRNTSEVAEIDLSYNKIKEINSDAFSDSKKLLRIDLSHNQLKFIAEDAFNGIMNLERIDLSHNYLRSVPAFPRNNQLKTIHLECNQIVYFNCPTMALVDRVLMYLPWQSMLSFYGRGSCEGNQFLLVPDTEREMLSLSFIGQKEMHINERSLRKFYTFIAGRDSFMNVTKLIPYFNVFIRNLDLSGNFIGAINHSTFERFDELVTLSLSDTKLTSFDFSMIKNQNYRLNNLDISHNQLTYLENVPYLARFFSLLHFNVAGNRIANIPDVIHYLRPTITALDLSGNFVGILNASTFERFNMLETLKLSNSNITISRINPFKTLKSLKHLVLSHNDLRSMNLSIFSNFSQLSRLEVAHCQITNVSRVIRNLKPTIKQLDLAWNFAGALKNRTFASLNNLESLNLSSSSIARFDFGILRNLTNLQVLDISLNKLKEANIELLPHSLKFLYLEGNDLTRIDNFHRSNYPWLKTLAISQNRFPCLNLRHFVTAWRHVEWYDDPIRQKHGKYCPCAAYGVSDFLSSVFSKMKFW